MAKEIPDGRKVPALLALMGGKTYSLLRNLTSPDDPATKGFDAIVKLLDNHLSPKPLVIAERFRFHKRDQKDGESIPVYVAELRKLSEHCDFKANLNDALRDRLVCGIKHGNIQKKLLSESDLTLQKAIDIATAMETAAKELNTGSAISVIPIRIYKELFHHKPLSVTNTRLKTYSGQTIIPAGIINVSVNYEGKKHNLDLFVVKNDSPSLFGRAWLKFIKLDWNSIKFLQTGKTTDENLQDILKKYKSVFSEQSGKFKGVNATLTLKENAQPKFCKARPVPYALKDKVEKELERLENEGIIQKVDHSDWATPIVAVPKGDNTVRICGDYKTTVNPQLQVDQYPLPKIQDIFASIAGGQRFTKIDLRQAYNQLEMNDNSKSYLTINTHKGLYSYNRLVFGISASPSIWQRTMDQVLKGIPNTSCILDDIIITGKTDDEHLKTLEAVLQRLMDYNLRVNEAKCKFFQEEITYCGHKIDANGLHKTQDKIEVVINAPKPENVTQLRAFLGLVNYFSHFLPNLASVLHPLYQLLKQNVKFIWTETAQKAFQNVKEMITSDIVLTHYDPDLPVKQACDSSSYGFVKLCIKYITSPISSCWFTRRKAQV